MREGGVKSLKFLNYSKIPKRILIQINALLLLASACYGYRSGPPHHRERTDSRLADDTNYGHDFIMKISSEQIQGLYFLAFAVSFLGYVIFAPLPALGAVISRMGYFVRMGALALGSTLAVMLGIAFITTFAVWAPSFTYIATYIAIGLAAGLYAGFVALGRSLDSGGGRGFAASGIVPFVNLYLALAAPNLNSARPTYAPANSFLRFLIGFFAFVLGSGIANGLGAWMKSPDGASTLLEGEIASINVSLPRKIDEITTLFAVRHDIVRRSVIYEHTLSLQNGYFFSVEKLKKAVTPNLCSDQGVREMLANGYVLEYKYSTVSGSPIDNFVFSRSDCQ